MTNAGCDGTVVMIHGFLGTDDLWQKVAPTGAVGLGLPGHDTVAHPERRLCASARFEEALIHLNERLPKGKCHLWGYSMGARMAIWMAVQNPDSVLSLTVIGGTPGISEQRERANRARREAEWQRVLAVGGLERFVDCFERQPLFRTQRRLPPSVQLTQRRMRLSHDVEQVRRSLSAMGISAMPDGWEQIGRLKMPVRCIVGEQDEVYRDIAARIVSEVPDGRLVCVPGCGHNPIIEAPFSVSRLLRSDRTVFGLKQSPGQAKHRRDF